MRIFVAVSVSDDIKNRAVDFQKRFENLPVRWLDGKNLHITLVPPWEEKNLKAAIGNLEKLEGKFKPFEIFFHGVYFGPNPRLSRLIWAKGEASQEFLILESECEKIFSANKKARKSANLAHPAREFSLHLTLARFRPEKFFGFPLKNLNEKILWRETVNGVVLMESRLLKSGAEYEILKEVKF